jgi:hypothetical protein
LTHTPRVVDVLLPDDSKEGRLWCSRSQLADCTNS